MNVIARLEYELAYYDFAVHRFNHYTTRTPLDRDGKQVETLNDIIKNDGWSARFYSILTFVSYLTPNSVYTYIKLKI